MTKFKHISKLIREAADPKVISVPEKKIPEAFPKPQPKKIETPKPRINPDESGKFGEYDVVNVDGKTYAKKGDRIFEVEYKFNPTDMRITSTKRDAKIFGTGAGAGAVVGSVLTGIAKRAIRRR